MAEKEQNGLVARWLIGKERDEDYARNSLPTNRFSLFWDIFKGRFGKLFLTNLIMLAFFLPLIAILVWRNIVMLSQGYAGPYGAGLGVGYPMLPNIAGVAELTQTSSDVLFFALLIPASVIAAVGVSGGFYIIRNMIWTEGVFVANDFWRGVKRNFLPVMEAMLVFSTLLFFVVWVGDLADTYVALGADVSWLLVTSKVVGYIVLCFAAIVCFWMISLGLNYKQGAWALFRNAVVMAVATFFQSVFFIALALLPVILAFFTDGFFSALGVMFTLLLGFSYIALLWLDFTQWAFDKFVNPTIGVQTGRGIYNRDKANNEEGKDESAAAREYKRQILAQGKSALLARPIKPIDDGMEVYQLSEGFSREDLAKMKRNRQELEESVRSYEQEHASEEKYVEYNRQFEERDKALANKTKGKKKAPRPPKMLK